MKSRKRTSLKKPKNKSVQKRVLTEAKFNKILRRFSKKDWLSVSLAPLAKQCGCSKRHVERLFLEQYGMTLREKRDQVRLEKACKLLSTTNTKVRKILRLCGYNMVHLFNKRFKREFGIPPSKWRQKHSKIRRAARK